MRISILVSAVILSGCATLSSPQDQKLTITQSSESVLPPVEFTAFKGLASYQWASKPAHAEWLACVPSKSKATILLMHADRAGFDSKSFCQSWMAQPFLAQGFDVLAINRPGYGASTGQPDFSGAQSMVAIAEARKAAVAEVKKLHPIVGIWGYSTGVTAAGLVARNLGGLKFAIFGGGVYDFHETLKTTTDSYIRSDLEAIQKTGGEKALEDRSIAYELTGLPPKIAIYHGKSDQSAPLAQAQAFADSLASNGQYAVSFQAIDGLGHEIPWQHHRKILEVLAHAQL